MSFSLYVGPKTWLKHIFFWIPIILDPFDDILPHLASQYHVMGGTSEWVKGGIKPPPGQERSGKER